MHPIDKFIVNAWNDFLKDEVTDHYSNPQNVEADADWCAKRKAEREQGGETNVYTTTNHGNDTCYNIVDSVISLTDVHSKGRA